MTYFFTSYGGKVFLRGCRKLPWQEDVPFNETQVQVLPGFLQRYPWTSKHRRWHLALNQPGTLLKKSSGGWWEPKIKFEKSARRTGKSPPMRLKIN